MLFRHLMLILVVYTVATLAIGGVIGATLDRIIWVVSCS